MSSPLRSARLRRILVAYTINRLGTWFGLVALSLAVFDHTHSALAVAALLFAGQALPAFVVPAIVARVEASRRRSELSALYMFEAIVTAGLAVLLWHFSLPAVLVLVAIDGTAALAASALLRSELARTAHAEAAGRPGAAPPVDATEGADASLTDNAEEAERRANAALNVAFSFTFVLGPIIGGAVVAAAGASAALFIDVASFVICAALLLDLHPHVEEAGSDSVRARLRAAWRHINETASLRTLFVAEAIALVFFESGGPIEVAYAKATLHAGDRGYGLLLTTWGAGAVLGSVLFARLIKRSLAIMLRAGTLAIGGAYVGFAGAPTLALACLAALVGGMGNGLQWPSMISTVQRITPQHLQGRLMGALESLGALCLAIGLPLGGLLVALSSPRAAFLVVGLGALATTAVLLRVSVWRSPHSGREEELAPALESQPGVRHEPATSEYTGD
ncbi:MAG TPA: MFS transporter [Solirubrobacteraceae bacterium]|nr:MFS transporter [Solirubrobacteraceae bacterium]